MPCLIDSSLSAAPSLIFVQMSDVTQLFSAIDAGDPVTVRNYWAATFDNSCTVPEGIIFSES